MLTVKNALAKSVILLVHILIISLECRISVGIVIIPSGLQATPGGPIRFFQHEVLVLAIPYKLGCKSVDITLLKPSYSTSNIPIFVHRSFVLFFMQRVMNNEIRPVWPTRSAYFFIVFSGVLYIISFAHIPPL